MSEVKAEDLVRTCLDAARRCLPNQTAVVQLFYAVEHLLASHQILQDRLETYMERSRPALSAARMHVPIGGGGSWSWRQQEQRKAEERRQKIAEIKARLTPETKAQLADDFAELFKPDSGFSFGSGGDNSTQLDHEKKPVQRKRSKRRK